MMELWPQKMMEKHMEKHKEALRASIQWVFLRHGQEFCFPHKVSSPKKITFRDRNIRCNKI